MPYLLSGMAQQQPDKNNPKLFAVVPAGQKFVKAKPGLSTDPQDRIRLAYRLLFTLDDALRTLMKRRGELSTYMIEALDTANFLQMPLVDITLEKKAPEVNMFMPVAIDRKIRAAAEKRHVSLNVIVNSAMAQWLVKRGLVDIRPL